MILNTKTFRALSVSHEGRQKDEVRHGIWKDIKEAAVETVTATEEDPKKDA